MRLADGYPRGFSCTKDSSPIEKLRYNGLVMNERITINPAVLVGKPVIRGTRIAVEFIVGLLAQGWTIDDILLEYDHITREDVQACLAYAHQLLADEKVYPVPA
jgi:uncharacterized protein (DUF433 family)